MYRSVEALRADLQQYKDSRTQDNSLEERIQRIIENLLQDPKYQTWDTEDLETYARGLISLSFAKYVDSVLKNSVNNTGKPSDPIWGKYTYEEILEMSEIGVNVPQEFLDWANAMAAADTVSYELDTTESEDVCTVSNMENETDDKTSLGRQRKLQKYSSKANAQEELLKDKNDELQCQSRELDSLQRDLDSSQKLAMDKIEEYSNEFKILDDKARSGEDLSEDEIKRYKELGAVLNTEGRELIAQSADAIKELDTLLDEMSTVSDIIDVNQQIASTLETLSSQYSQEEGGKRLGSTNIDSGKIFGDLELYAHAALSNTLSLSSSIIGINLEADSRDIQSKMNTNTSTAEIIRQNINDIRDAGNSSVINSGDIKRVKETESTESSGYEDDELNTEGTIDSDTAISSDEASDVESSEETEDISGTEEAGEPAGAEEEDSLKASVQEYLDNSTIKISEIETFKSEFASLRDQVKSLQGHILRDKLSFKTRFNAAIKDYKSLLDKVKSGKELDGTEQEEYETLNAKLDTETGEFSTSLQSKISVLDDFTNMYSSGRQMVSEDIEYGNAAVEAGKSYALSERDGGEISHTPGKMTGKYDTLYGKSGESLGRDVIDAGKNLISEARHTRKQFMVTKSLNEFASKRSADLSETLAESNSKVNDLNMQFAEIFGTNESKEQDEESNNTAVAADVSQDISNDISADVTDEIETGTELEQPEEGTIDSDTAISSDEASDVESSEETEDISGTEEAGEPAGAEEEDSLKASVQEYLDNSTIKISEIETFKSEFASLRDQVKSLQGHILRDKLSFKTRFNAAIKDYKSLLDKVKSGKELDGTEQEEYETLNAKLDTETGEFSTSLQSKISVLDDFTNMYSSGRQMVSEDIEYGNAAVEAGKSYALSERDGGEISHTPGKMTGKYDTLYGKSGESLGRDVIDAGKNLISEARHTRKQFMVTKSLNEFASKRSADLSETLAESNSKVNDLNMQFAEIFGTNESKEQDEESNNTAVAADVSQDISNDISADVTDEIENQTVSNISFDSAESVTQSAAAVQPKSVSSTAAAISLSKLVDSAAPSIARASKDVVSEDEAKNLTEESVKTSLKEDVLKAARASMLSHGEELQQKDSKEETKRKILIEFERKKREEIRKGVEKINSSAKMKH